MPGFVSHQRFHGTHISPGSDTTSFVTGGTQTQHKPGTSAAISRRATLRLAAAAIGSSLVGCDGLGGESIRFWNGFTGPDGRTMLGIIRKFNAGSPLPVVMQRMEWATYYNKLFVAGVGGRAPDVFVVHSDQIERLIRAGFVRELSDRFYPGGSIDQSDFDPVPLQAVLRGTKSYGVPLDSHPIGMYYNRRHFDAAGITDLSALDGDGFVESLQKLTRRDVDPTVWGFVFTWFRTNMFSLISQWGGRIFADDGRAVLLDSPECVKAFEFARDLIGKYKVAPEPSDLAGFLGFRQGRVGLLWEGIYMLTELQRQTDLDFGAAPMPKIGPIRTGHANSHNLCLRADLSGDRLEAAWNFVKFLSNNCLDWADAGQVPVRPSARATERFATMTAQSEFAKQLPYVTYLPSVPYTFEYQGEFDLAAERVLRGSMPAAESLALAKRKIEQAVERFYSSNDAGGRA